MSTHQNLEAQFRDQIETLNERKRISASIIREVIDECVKTHGFPPTAISCHEPSSEMPDGAGHSPSWVIKEKPNGSWGLNLAFRLGSQDGSYAYMIAIVRPEVRFEESQIELGFTQGNASVQYGNSPESNTAAIAEFAEHVVKEVSNAIRALGEPQEKSKCISGFYPGSARQ